ncbi:TadE/TadG family type IV pilus assembly protein [Streptomyces phytohabitans]|uniref:TadE/TadG family type IV pilus assembly protein n=1 Tax=Streptomyces phytohabitans TaxID=1150371 RepID=UPI00345C216A
MPTPVAVRALRRARPPAWSRVRAVLRRASARRTRERGASSLEFAGMIPFLLLVGLAGIQLGLAGYAVQQAGTGARAAARTAGQQDAGDCAGAARSAMSGWTAGRASVDCSGGDEEATATTEVTIPSLIPGIDSFGSASRTVTMPSD